MPARSDELLAQLSISQRSQMERFAALMLRWNQKINVTAAKTVEAVLDHCVDGIVASQLIPQTSTTLVDIGSGGGLPIIPMAIMRPDVQMLGIEPIAKKWAFVVSAGRELELANVEARQCRVEDVMGTKQFDVATSKATFDLSRWVEIGSQLVEPGGAVLCFGSATAAPIAVASTDVLHFRRAGADYWISRIWTSGHRAAD